MEPADLAVTGARERRPRGRRGARLVAVLVALLAATLIPPTMSVQAAPRDNLDELERQAAALSRQYRGELVELSEALRAAKRAADKAARMDREFAATRAEVARLAASSYKSGTMEPVLRLALSDDPQAVIDQAVIVEHLARVNGERLRALQQVAAADQRARQEAEQRVVAVRQQLSDLGRQRQKVAELIDKFRPESPTTGDNITPRMRKVRDEIDRRFGPFPTIGCWRANGGIPGGGEHPLGRACDFMLSTGGSMPSADNVQRGWDLANWAKANAASLGVMYIIYRQQIWDARGSGGWQMMEDRGGITANHYDHVHISVF